MKDRSDASSHHERTLLPRSYISLLTTLNTTTTQLYSYTHKLYFLLKKTTTKKKKNKKTHTQRRLKKRTLFNEITQNKETIKSQNRMFYKLVSCISCYFRFCTTMCCQKTLAVSSAYNKNRAILEKQFYGKRIYK